MRTKPVIICYGEVLWDVLPEGIFLGGAPFNVAYHLSQLGGKPYLLSAIGPDFLGQEIIKRMKSYHMPTDLIQTNQYPTGTVQVDFIKKEPHYRIHKPCSWDQIKINSQIKSRLKNSHILIYGSLAMRSIHNYTSFISLLEIYDGLKIFDINLRKPFCPKNKIHRLIQHANFIKCNQDELFLLTQSSPRKKVFQVVHEFAKKFKKEKICVTMGNRGAGIYNQGSWIEKPAPQIQVQDTIGAGDSFLAMLVWGHLTHPENTHWILKRALSLSAFVASQRGATPPYQRNRFLS